MLEGLKYLLEPAFEIVGMVDDRELLLHRVGDLRPDVVVMDLSISVEMARQLNRQNPHQGIIVLSSYDEPAVMRHVMESGSRGFVLLHSVAWDLIPAIGAVLDGHTFVSQGVQR